MAKLGNQIREEFPILKTKIGKHDLVYLDNGATTQKPLSVIQGISDYYLHSNSNIHRGVHTLSQKATSEYEAVREQIGLFCGCLTNEVVFTYGTTDGINLVSTILGEEIQKGDEIIITEQDHHSNLVPWHMLAEKTGAEIKVVPIQEDGTLNLEVFKGYLVSGKVKIAAFNHVSNSLGTINPVDEMVEWCKEQKVYTVVDGAQAIAHIPLNFKELNADFYCFSGHKMYGPTGIGVVLGKEKLLKQLPPYRGGGEMIAEVSNTGFTVNTLPHKYEAGTPAIAQVIGLGKAIEFLNLIGVKKAAKWEDEILHYATEQIQDIPGITLIGTAEKKCGILSFIHESAHPYDVGAILDKLGVAVRTGHHCCQPVMAKFEISGTIRASFAVYNTKEDVDLFIQALKKALEMLS